MCNRDRYKLNSGLLVHVRIIRRCHNAPQNAIMAMPWSTKYTNDQDGADWLTPSINALRASRFFFEKPASNGTRNVFACRS